MKYIFMEDRKLRFYFLEDGGFDLIIEFMKTDDVDIVHEVLLILDDLIYEHFDLENNPKIIIAGMVEYLTKYEIEKSLFELYQLTQKHKSKYEKIENDLNFVIATIESEKKRNNTVLN